jgi:hypothetical protein
LPGRWAEIENLWRRDMNGAMTLWLSIHGLRFAHICDYRTAYPNLKPSTGLRKSLFYSMKIPVISLVEKYKNWSYDQRFS